MPSAGPRGSLPGPARRGFWKPKGSPRGFTKGFTLIEVLVVVAIIAVLAAILFPVFATAREAARRASCSSNLKQIGLGMMMYTQDYAKYPRSWFGTDANAGGDATNSKWMDVLHPYVKSEETFDCPSSEGLPYKYRDGKNYGSYGMNCAYYALDDGKTAPYGSMPNRVKNPTATVQVLDTFDEDGDSWAVEWEKEPPAITEGPPRRLATAEERHNETLNTLFCDGHVKAFTLENLMRKNAKGTLTYFTNEDD